MNFNSAFDTTLGSIKNIYNYVTGENGALANSTLNPITTDNLENNKTETYNNLLIELFLLVRDDTRVNDKLSNIFKMIDSSQVDDKKIYLENLIKTILFIRQPRQGKGERKLFYDILNYTWNKNKDITKILISLIPEFGYWKDINNLYNIDNYEMNAYLIEMMGDKIIEDYNLILNDSTAKIGLVGKWAPRENSKYHAFSEQLAYYICRKLNIFDRDTDVLNKKYRTMIAKLNTHLKTVQTYMCQKHWKDIDFKNVPSISMTKLTKAFQDEKVSPYPKETKIIKKRYGNNNKKTFIGRRHTKTDPDYEDRNKCRENLFEYIKSGNKINSSVTDLSHIIAKYLVGDQLDIVWEAQWISRVEELRTLINGLEKNPSIFPMVDLSSSMTGNPIIQAITLGLFTSMILDSNPSGEENEFANRFMSFNSVPQLVKLPRTGSLKDKIDVMKKWCASGMWGGSTNIQSAIRLLLNIAIQHKLEKEKMPKVLAIFSDMQFDVGDSSWNETSFEMIKKEFIKYGYDVPEIIFWNLRENTQGYQVLTDTPNTTMLSGFSTRMMDLFLSGSVNELKEDAEDTEDVENNIEENKNKKTTSEVFEKALNHEMFTPFNQLITDKINNILNIF